MSGERKNLDALHDQALKEVLRFFHGDIKQMDRWLSSEVRGLGYTTPREALSTREGIAQLRTLIARLENGIPT